MPQETCFIPVDVSAGSSPPHSRNSGRWRRKSTKSDTFKCHIYLQDDSDFYHLVPKKASGRELLDYVFWRIDLREKEYFGLKFDNAKGMQVWLDPSRKIRKQIPKRYIHSTDSFTSCDFFLQVKYFTPDPSSLREEYTRYLFFLHIRRDILEGKLPCSQHHAARLFSYSVQSELGDYEPTKHTPGYTSKFLFIPGQTTELERAIALHHKERKGMAQPDAELHFLTYTVLNLEFYGLDSYPVVGSNKENLQLGLAPSGVKIYKDWKMIALFAWGRILKVSQKRKRLSLIVKSKLGSDGCEEKAICFELESKILCEVLYDNLVDYLQFYRMRLNLRESRDASRMLAKFRYSTRFMKRDQDAYTTSQIIQPTGFRVTTPGLCANGNNNEDVGTVRSVSVNADVEGTFQKSKSIGGYGDRRDHPDLQGLANIASGTQLPFRTINTSIPPDIPPKSLLLRTNDIAEMLGGRRSVSPREVVLGRKSPVIANGEQVKLEDGPASTTFYKTNFVGSFDSTDSHSNDTRSSTASPSSPRYTTLQISRFLSHESPIEVRKVSKESVISSENSNIVKKEQLNSNNSNEQRCSVMLDPPDDFANSEHTKPISSDSMPTSMDTNKQNMIEQYLSSYTTGSQSKEAKINSNYQTPPHPPPPPPPPPPPIRISSFSQPQNNSQISNSSHLPTTDTTNKKILLLDEIKQRLEKVKIDKPQRPPPTKPKKRYNLDKLPPSELENAANLIITPDTESSFGQLKFQEKSVERSSPKTPNEELFEDKTEQLEKGKINLLEEITHELDTRKTNPKDTQPQYLNLDILDRRKKPHFTTNTDDTPPPTPPILKTSPRHSLNKSPHPTRATHSYTTQGLILSDPNPKKAGGLEKSKSLDAPFGLSLEERYSNVVGLDSKRSKTPAPFGEQLAPYKPFGLSSDERDSNVVGLESKRSKTPVVEQLPLYKPIGLSSEERDNNVVGLESKRSKTPAHLVEQMAQYKQRSLTKTLDLQQNNLPSLQEYSLNTTFDIPNPTQSLPPKPNFPLNYNQQIASLPTNIYKQNEMNRYNSSFYPTTANSLPKQTQFPPQNMRNFAQNSYPNAQHPTMGYREHSSTITTTTFRNSPTPTRLSYQYPSYVQNSQYSMNYIPPHMQTNTVASNDNQPTFRYVPPVQIPKPQQEDFKTIRFQQARESSITHWV